MFLQRHINLTENIISTLCRDSGKTVVYSGINEAINTSGINAVQFKMTFAFDCALYHSLSL